MQNDLLIPIIVAILAGPPDVQQDAYPLHGQSAAKLRKDETACDQWASSQSGYVPANPPAVAPVPPAAVTGSGSRAKGAAAQQAAGLQASYYLARKTCLGGRGYTVN
jgi:hypothetical protein